MLCAGRAAAAAFSIPFSILLSAGLHAQTPDPDPHAAAPEALRAAVERAQAALEGMQAHDQAGAIRITVAVSNSLSADYLQQLSGAAARIGARLVVRGADVSGAKPALAAACGLTSGGRISLSDLPYVGRDAAYQKLWRGAMREGLVAMAAKCAASGFEVDPQFFRAHRIEAVPVFAFETPADGGFEGASRPPQTTPAADCGSGKAESPSKTYIVRGAVTLDWALDHAASRAADQGFAGDARALAALARRCRGEDGIGRAGAQDGEMSEVRP